MVRGKWVNDASRTGLEWITAIDAGGTALITEMPMRIIGYPDIDGKVTNAWRKRRPKRKTVHPK